MAVEEQSKTGSEWEELAQWTPHTSTAVCWLARWKKTKDYAVWEPGCTIGHTHNLSLAKRFNHVGEITEYVGGHADLFEAVLIEIKITEQRAEAVPPPDPGYDT